MRSVLLASLLTVFCATAQAADLIGFWDTPQRGANSFNRLPPDQAYYQALRDYGAGWVRLSYDKWKPAQRDFLLGSADAYQGLVESDLATLKASLDRAHAAGLKVVVTPLSLPGMRWSQNNGEQFDDRLWQDPAYWRQAVTFWRDLAQALKDHPGVAAYNLINEPAPEKHGGLAEHAGAEQMQQWYRQHRGTPRDLPALYRQIIAAVREVDARTPIMLDAGWYAAADAFAYWPQPIADQRVLYSFHMYEPYAATSAGNLNRTPAYTYPGRVPFAGGMRAWDRATLQQYLQRPLDWAQAHGVPRKRMVAGEFGCMRRWVGCNLYLEDVLGTLEHAGLHWAFYSFREDNWDGMDYELGQAAVPWAYWQAIDKGLPDPLKRGAASLAEPIRKRLGAGNAGQ